MIEGGCLCGKIRYQYDGELNELSMCHCKQCQKAQGTAYAAVSPIDVDKFKFVSGSELLKEYRATPEKVRVFCSNCGSPIYSARDDLPKVKRIRVGTVDDAFQCEEAYHTFTATKASWELLHDNLPKYREFKTTT